MDLAPGESIFLDAPAPVDAGEYVLCCRFHRAVGNGNHNHRRGVAARHARLFDALERDETVRR